MLVGGFMSEEVCSRRAPTHSMFPHLQGRSLWKPGAEFPSSIIPHISFNRICFPLLAPLQLEFHSETEFGGWLVPTFLWVFFLSP